jgi:hypothetical protein
MAHSGYSHYKMPLGLHRQEVAREVKFINSVIFYMDYKVMYEHAYITYIMLIGVGNHHN